MNEDIFSRFIFQNFNQPLVGEEFPHHLKQAEVIPVISTPRLFNAIFPNKFSTQKCLLYMIKNGKESLYQRGHSGALLTDLSKEFDCIMYDLLIAKRQAYGFDSDM